MRMRSITKKTSRRQATQGSNDEAVVDLVDEELVRASGHQARQGRAKATRWLAYATAEEQPGQADAGKSNHGRPRPSPAIRSGCSTLPDRGPPRVPANGRACFAVLAEASLTVGPRTPASSAPVPAPAAARSCSTGDSCICCALVGAAFAGEDQIVEARHVEGSAERGDQQSRAHRGTDPAQMRAEDFGGKGASNDGVFGEETGKKRNPADSQPTNAENPALSRAACGQSSHRVMSPEPAMACMTEPAQRNKPALKKAWVNR